MIRKVKLALQDFFVENDAINIEDNFLELYEEYNTPFLKLFAIFHQKLNHCFDFMNSKIDTNRHYNANESRELIDTIAEIKKIFKILKNTEFKFKIINDNYITYLKEVQLFLVASGGSPIPDNFKKMEISKYEPIFKLENKNVTVDFEIERTLKSPHNALDLLDDFFNIKAKPILKINGDILSHINPLLKDKHYYSAVEESFKIVREKLKKITGTEKATDAFAERNTEKIFGRKPTTDIEKNSFQGVKFLHMAIQNFRNVYVHSPAEPISENEAIHYIVLASLAYDLINKKQHDTN